MFWETLEKNSEVYSRQPFVNVARTVEDLRDTTTEFGDSRSTLGKDLQAKMWEGNPTTATSDDTEDKRVRHLKTNSDGQVHREKSWGPGAIKTNEQTNNSSSLKGQTIYSVKEALVKFTDKIFSWDNDFDDYPSLMILDYEIFYRITGKSRKLLKI